jgi:hypothetical protein
MWSIKNKTVFCVLSRNNKIFAVSSLFLHLLASQTGDFFLPHPVLVYGTRKVQVKQLGLKLNGAHQLLIYGDNFNMLGGNVHAIKENRICVSG